MKPIFATARPAFLALCLLACQLSPVNAAEPTMHAALQRLVASQHLDQTWPLLIHNASSTGARKVLQGALDALEADPTLSPDQRARAREAAATLAPQIAAEVDAMHAQLDINTLMFDMMDAIYPKYYSMREIEEMARFYESPAFRKLTRISIQAQGEINRTRQNPALVWARYDATFTPEEKRALAAFQNSPTGQKVHRLAPQVQQESVRYLFARTDGLLTKIAARYHERIAQAARASTRD